MAKIYPHQMILQLCGQQNLCDVHKKSRKKSHLGHIQKHKCRQHAKPCLFLQVAKVKGVFLFLATIVLFLSTMRRAVSRDSHQYSHPILCDRHTPSPAAPWRSNFIFPSSCQLQLKTQHDSHRTQLCLLLLVPTPHTPTGLSDLSTYSGLLNTNMNKQRQFLFFFPLLLKNCKCKHWDDCPVPV